MLAYAEERAQAQGVSNVEFLRGGFLSYEHRGEPLQAAVSQIALHHLPDFWKQIALHRLAALLPQGGKLFLRDVVYSFDTRNHGSFLDGLLAQAERQAGIEYAGRICCHVKSEYSTMDWIMRGMLERAGFEVKREETRKGFLAVYKCRRI